MEISPLGVRKGAWTAEEDILLKQCIEKHGEGKWHQVPSRAGLNRCRKSCRLRWLNYLKPSIKRGHFADDEVDLIIRLHKLLGNRWSLIAGRLPGRTANDVKNYWNTHLVKKMNLSANKGLKPKAHQNPSKPNINVFKPRPQTVSMNSFPWTNLDRNNNHNSNDNNNPATQTTVLSESRNLLLVDSYCNENSHYVPTDYDEMLWWENLTVKDNEVDEQLQGSFNNFNMSGLGEHAINKEMGESSSIDFQIGNYGGFGELFYDVELWNVLNPEPEDLCLNY